jgi:hypothetical protein
MLAKVGSAAVVGPEGAVVEVEVDSSSHYMRPWQEALRDYVVAKGHIA